MSTLLRLMSEHPILTAIVSVVIGAVGAYVALVALILGEFQGR